MKEMVYKTLIAGIDTLEIGYCVMSYLLSQEEWDMLEAAKMHAQSTRYDKGTIVELRGYEFTVRRAGSGRYRYVLFNEDIDILINDNASSGEHFPELKVRFRSQFLWCHNGWQDAVRKMDEWLGTWAGVTRVKISRLDITADFMGKLPLLSPIFEEVVTRTKSKSAFGSFGRHIEGNQLSGYTFGKNDLSCRVYDKTKEIIIHGKKWFEDLWKESGWLDGEAVTRVEFQCRRKVLRMMQIEKIEDLLIKLPDLWRYLTDDWLTIREVQDDSHRTRWPITDYWKVVQNTVSCFGEVFGISRLKQRRPSRDKLESSLKGYAYSLTALVMRSQPSNSIEHGKNYVEYFLYEMLNDSEFEEEVQKRSHKYDNMEN